jgi:hypothetical protein
MVFTEGEGTGGSAEANGFTVSTGPNGILGVSIEGSVIPVGDGLLTSLSGATFDDFEACITDPVLSIVGEGFQTITTGDCIATDAVADCNGDANGSAVEDCAGVCDGDSVLSGCDNACNSTAVEDCAGVCDGDSVLSGCDNACNSTAEEDECGECGGSNDCFTQPENIVNNWTLVQQSDFSSEDCSGEAILTITGPFSLEEGGESVDCNSISIELSADGSGVITCNTAAFDITQDIDWADNGTNLCVDAGDGFNCAPYSVEGEMFTQQGYDEESSTCSELQYQLTSALAIDEFGIPSNFSVYQNYPNPFNPSTTIEFDVATPTNISLVVYDLTGKEVYSLASGYHVPGRYSVVWNANDSNGHQVSSGMYIYQLRTSDAVLTKKLVLLR